MPVYNYFDEDSMEFLTKLPTGQIYIFADAEKGIDQKLIWFIEKIHKTAKMVNPKGKIPPVFVMPSEYYTTAYATCMIPTNDGAVLECADNGSVIEMVYDFYGVDFMENHPKIEEGREKDIRYSISGHPTRFHLPNYKASNENTGFDPSSMSALTSDKNKWSEAKAKKEILKALWKAELTKKDDVVLDYKQILEDFEAEKNKTYTLKIDIQLLKDVSCDSDKPKTRDCHFYMVDETGEEQEIQMEAQEKAVYLMFLVFEGGILIDDFDRAKTAKPYEDVFKEIHQKMANNNFSKGELTVSFVNFLRNRIKEKFANVTQNKYLEKFCIEGFRKGEFRIDIATQEHRDYVLKMFNLTMPEIE